MADAPQTFAEWGSNRTVPALQRAVINTIIADRPLLGLVPMQMWPGTEVFEWTLNKTLPTITWNDESTAHDATQAIRRKLQTQLSYGFGDVEIPIHSSNAYDAVGSMEITEATDLARAMGVSLSNKLWTGTYMDVTNDVTIYGTGVAGAEGIDAVTAISVNMAKGFGDIQYTHAGTTLKFRAPNSTVYGAAVDISGGDGDYTLYDGLDPTQSVTVTVDVSDFTTGAADLDLPGALQFGTPTNIAGLYGLAQLDSNQIKTPSTNGDAATLAHLDELEELCVGPKGEKLFVVNNRTRIALKHLIGGVGGMRQGEFQGRDLDKYDLNYEGVPIVADSNIATDETQGASIGICTRMYCVRLNRDVGYHMFNNPSSGPNDGTMSPVTSDHSEGGDGFAPDIPLPVYMRRIGEAYNKQYYKWRISTSVAAVLKRSTSLSMRYGVTT